MSGRFIIGAISAISSISSRAAGQDGGGVLGLLGEAIAQDATNLAVAADALPYVLRRPVAAVVIGAAGGRTLAGQPTARRRAVIRKPVWATIRWSGRTDRPSTFQVRTIDSHDSGSVNRPQCLSASTVRESWVVVAA